MSIFDVLSLLGGLAMFLYGMRLMGDSLKENSSATLKAAMEKVTNSPIKSFIMGLLVTALIQSSTATIVITSGLVGAGILTLHQSLGIIIGANVGTTVTGQIIRLLDLNTSSGGGAEWLRFFQPSTLAPIALIIGMVMIMAVKSKKSKSIGGIAIGFGILFTGLLEMTGAVSTLSQSGIVEQLFTGLDNNPVLGYITGSGVAFVLQSSSAAVGIMQAFSATGLMSFKGIYAVIVGIYLGDCVTTAIVCSIGAKPDARRVGIINIVYNLTKTLMVLIGVTVAHQLGLLDWIWSKPVNSTIIANTNSLFNIVCAICLFPLIGFYEKMALKIVKDEVEEQDGAEYQERIDALSPAFFQSPALALRSCYDLLVCMLETSKKNLKAAYDLMGSYSEAKFDGIGREEDAVDLMMDNLSRYMVELLAHLHTDYHLRILNQYYKVSTEFERIGDQAYHIAEQARNMATNNTTFSAVAQYEISVLWDLTQHILNLTETTFKKRDINTASQIEPLVQVAGEMVAEMKNNHFKRMGTGECNLYADACFSNLLAEFKRIADVCSNVGIATIVRVQPELADHEHLYFEQLHSGNNATFNEAFDAMHTFYFEKMNNLPEEVLAQRELEKELRELEKKEKKKEKKEKKKEKKQRKKESELLERQESLSQSKAFAQSETESISPSDPVKEPDPEQDEATWETDE